MATMMFEWDPLKNQTNARKHGIRFEEARCIFEGPTVESTDTRHHYGETRIQALGQMAGFVIYVVYTWRGSARRLISARLANQAEREVFYERCPHGLEAPSPDERSAD